MTANVTYIDDDDDFNAESAEVKDLMSSIATLLQSILEGIPVITRYQLVHQLGLFVCLFVCFCNCLLLII
jgi:hypothetical protein